MSTWAPKRFWQQAASAAVDGGFAILLDGRPVRTPAKNALVVPTETIASRIAAEWQAQEGRVDPTGMAWTRSANATVDKVATGRDGVIGLLADYAATDLLCYRAEAPEALVRRQGQAWDPMLDWAQHRFGARLAVTHGLMPVAQDPDALARLRAAMTPMSDFQLTGFHDLVTLSGSYVIALSAACRADSATALFDAARLDELWQAEQWGLDEEAELEAVHRRSAFLHAADFFHAA